MIKVLSAVALAFVVLLATHPQVQAQAATIGPGTPCTVTVPNPTTNNDGTPLTVPILKLSFYLDPPVGGPVIGTTVPTFSVTPTATGAGASNTVSVCKNVTAPISSGNHTAAISFTDAGGEGAGSAPVPFSFAGKPPAAPAASAIIFQ